MLTPSDSEASFIFVPDNSTRVSHLPAAEGSAVQGATSTVDLPEEKHEYNHPSLDASYAVGSSGSYAHDWSLQATGALRIHGRHIIDRFGRVCNLRGVNLSGSSKTPTNHEDDIFPANHHSMTFVGRPFPLEEADQHFARLRRWGLTFVRFLVTWEAIEHEGPGKYDLEYLAYLRQILSLLPKYGMKAFVCLHQDVWSRYSGGSGAPAWTLEAVGFDLHALEKCGAAWLLGVKGGGHIEAERGIWPCGYQKLAAATMATCFWGGDTFAPKLKIKMENGDEVPVQHFLQNTFLDMCETLARAVGDLESVIGFEPMNEPHRGYIQAPSLHSFDYNTDLHLSHVPSALQSFMLGAGHPTVVPHWTRAFPMPTRLTGHDLLNAEGQKAWRPDGPTNGECLWAYHGVWGWDVNKNEGVVLRESYFSKHPMTGEKVDWYTNFYYPFLKKWSDRLRSTVPQDKLYFVEPIPNEFTPSSWSPQGQIPNMIYAPHWYDLNALFKKTFGDFSVNVQGLSRGMFPLRAFYWGQRGVRANYSLQIRNIVEAAYRVLGETPIIFGECGVPMDINERSSFENDDWTWQARMMDALITALEGSLVGFTLWNYNPANTDAHGDNWNGENFSWFSQQRALPASVLDYEQTSPTLDNGARILSSVVRPYPAKTAGIPIRFEYEMTTGSFTFEWANPFRTVPATDSEQIIPRVASPPMDNHPPLQARECEIFVPSILTQGRKIVVQGLAPEDRFLHDQARQTLFVLCRDETPGKVHRVTVLLNPPVKPLFKINDLRSDFGSVIVMLLGVVIGILAYWLAM